MSEPKHVGGVLGRFLESIAPTPTPNENGPDLDEPARSQEGHPTVPLRSDGTHFDRPEHFSD